VMHRRSSEAELDLGGNAVFYRGWRLLIRYIAPAGVILVFLNAVGLLDVIGLS